MKKLKKRTVLKGILMIMFICSLVLNVIFINRGGYADRVLVKLGMKEPVVETDWTRVGWQRCMEYLDYDADIVFFGDSILGMKSRVEMLNSVSPEKVFILVGINSLTDSNLDRCTGWYDSLISDIEAELPEVEVYIQSVLPVSEEKEKTCADNTVIKDFNGNLRDIADEYECQYIDLYPLYEQDGCMNPELTKDGLHLKTEAYNIWADAIEGHINE